MTRSRSSMGLPGAGFEFSRPCSAVEAPEAPCTCTPLPHYSTSSTPLHLTMSSDYEFSDYEYEDDEESMDVEGGM